MPDLSSWHPEQLGPDEAKHAKITFHLILGSREGQYSGVAVVVYPRLISRRKTGITVRDTGIRDEHGLEPIDHLFSSPEKSPEKAPKSTPRSRDLERNTQRNANATLNSEEMDMGESMYFIPRGISSTILVVCYVD